MKKPIDVLVCFALPDEIRFFKPTANVEVLVTGMGRCAAENSFTAALERFDPRLVLTTGFAGALTPHFSLNTLLFNSDAIEPHRTRLQQLGAHPTRFHCAERVLVTASEKAIAYASTKCGAVEMESRFIHEICRARNISCLTLRVVSDRADEDLPMDFNNFATADGKSNLLKLIGHILLRPTLIPTMLRFGKQTNAAARILGEAIQKFVAFESTGAGA